MLYTTTAAERKNTSLSKKNNASFSYNILCNMLYINVIYHHLNHVM